MARIKKSQSLLLLLHGNAIAYKPHFYLKINHRVFDNDTTTTLPNDSWTGMPPFFNPMATGASNDCPGGNLWYQLCGTIGFLAIGFIGWPIRRLGS